METKSKTRPAYEENPPVTEELLCKMTRRIRKAGDPLQIILFGSHARGEAGPHSDLDLLVIENAGRSRRERIGSLEHQVMEESCVLYARKSGEQKENHQQGRAQG